MVTGEKAAARHAAEEPESCCPVCLATAEGRPECANCRWTLEGPAVLGPLTPEIRHAFDDRLASARRRLDLTAAARAAGYPGRGVPERLTRLEALLRGGPPQSAERGQVLAELADDLTVTESPELLPDGVVIEIGSRGLRAVTVRNGAEQAEATEWPWAELLPGLPDSADETLSAWRAASATVPPAPPPHRSPRPSPRRWTCWPADCAAGRCRSACWPRSPGGSRRPGRCTCHRNARSPARSGMRAD